jgi:hypothetical protein
MTQDEVISMAKEAGCIPRRHPDYWEDVQIFATPDVLQSFAKLVAAAERKEWEKEFAGMGEWACVYLLEERNK